MTNAQNAYTISHMDQQLVIKVYIDNITPLRAYAYSIVHNEEDANDIVQELAVRIIRAMDAGMEIKYPKTFLFRCTRNLSIDLKRKKRETPQPDETFDLVFRQEEAGFAETDVNLSLERYINAWPQEMKDAFIRHYFEFEPIKSIAEEMNMDPAVLRKRFQRMREQIPKSIFLTTMILNLFRI